MRDEIVARISLYTTAGGGRKSEIRAPIFNCPVEISGELFDCRFTLDRNVAPGSSDTVRLRFLFPDPALPVVAPGGTFRIWEGRFVGEGTVLERVPCTKEMP